VSGEVDFFISYTASDEPWAEWIAWQLEDAGYTTRVQAWDFAAGNDFAHEMIQALRESRTVLALLSSAYTRSAFAESEWRAAFARDPSGSDRRLIPIRLEECEIPELLATRVYIDLVDAEADTARHRLLTRLRSERGKPDLAPGFPRGRWRGSSSVRPLLKFPGDGSRRHGVLSRDPTSRLAIPTGCARVVTPVADVAVALAAYTTVGELLDDLFTNYLTEDFSPFSYGREWVLVGSADGYGDKGFALASPRWVRVDDGAIAAASPEETQIFRQASPKAVGLVDGREFAITDLSRERFAAVYSSRRDVGRLLFGGDKCRYFVSELAAHIRRTDHPTAGFGQVWPVIDSESSYGRPSLGAGVYNVSGDIEIAFLARFAREPDELEDMDESDEIGLADAKAPLWPFHPAS
jgi:TIR domain